MPYEREPQTLGQHLKKRRLESGLLQRDLRKRFGLEKETYANWEKDRCQPSMRHWPGIIAFLGYDPTLAPVTVGERLRAYRRCHGVSRKALAARLQVYEGTLWRWESDNRIPNFPELRVAIAEILKT